MADRMCPPIVEWSFLPRDGMEVRVKLPFLVADVSAEGEKFKDLVVGLHEVSLPVNQPNVSFRTKPARKGRPPNRRRIPRKLAD